MKKSDILIYLSVIAGVIGIPIIALIGIFNNFSNLVLISFIMGYVAILLTITFIIMIRTGMIDEITNKYK